MAQIRKTDKKNISNLKSLLRTVETLTEALPYLQKFGGKTFVIKYGGHAMGDKKLAEQFAGDIALLKQVGINPVIVHGGGPQIGDMLNQMKIESEFINGLRVTDKRTVEIVEMVLAGSINKEVVTAINDAGGTAVGISGKDGNLIQARKLKYKRMTDSNVEEAVDLGFVGEPYAVNTKVLDTLASSHMIPVIAPLGIGLHGTTYNINADTAAGAIAGAIGAARLLMLTDVAGVLDKKGELITDITARQADALIKNGTISGGMIPKIETCLDAVKDGVEASVILDGRVPHALLLEIFTEHGAGTMIRAKEG
ncbi:MAG: Acetylglutamate kinase [Alphaproteobacteria bacterium MarineAlpha11_Bin1]|nr:MAG: Acetylglutamate kinase [Alphaproteobacteria bacterium MarineAlpha11_Bin1]|tara:strand:- start:10415 stop:11344 length:930 start_codon:yes stop_codon:yes gene_type:complete